MLVFANKALQMLGLNCSNGLRSLDDADKKDAADIQQTKAHQINYLSSLADFARKSNPRKEVVLAKMKAKVGKKKVELDTHKPNLEKARDKVRSANLLVVLLVS